jgi:hypothetical protein
LLLGIALSIRSIVLAICPYHFADAWRREPASVRTKLSPPGDGRDYTEAVWTNGRNPQMSRNCVSATLARRAFGR